MRDGLNKTGRPIYFSLSGWNPHAGPPYGPYGGGKTLGNSWRIGPDDTNWHGILANININSRLAKFAGPGVGMTLACCSPRTTEITCGFPSSRVVHSSRCGV